MVNRIKIAFTAAAVLGSVAIAQAQTGGTSYTYNGSYEGYTFSDQAPSAIRADQLNINGAVGLPLNATAQIPDKGQWRVQGSYYDLGSGDNGTQSYKEQKMGIYTAGRLGNLPLEVNIGVSKMNVDASGYTGFATDPADPVNVAGTGLAVGAKYQVWRSEDGTGMAAMGLGYDAALYDDLYAYFVMSKSFGSRGMTGHLGVRYDRYKINNISSSYPSVYVGAELPLDKKGRFAITAEVQSKNSNEEQYNSKIPYSLALRLGDGKGLSASFGVQRQGTLTSVQPGTLDGSANLFFQLGKSF